MGFQSYIEQPARPSHPERNRDLQSLSSLDNTPLTLCGRSSGVEHNLAKVGVEGSNPFARSSELQGFPWFPGFICGLSGAFTDRVVPILQDRGMFRREYKHDALRSHLGLLFPMRDKRKQPVFEKSGAKTFVIWAGGGETTTAQFKNVFCFFFPKKKRFLPCYYFRPAARMAESERVGVSASGSTRQWRIAGFFAATARSKAGQNSSVLSTRSPCPPKALA